MSDVRTAVTNVGEFVVMDKNGTSDKAILEVCNSENPAGTTGGWQVVKRSLDQDNVEEVQLPVQCGTHEDREHLLVSC